MQFDIIRSDIVNVPADAVVLPANTELKEGSGVSAALFEAAGRFWLTQACKKIGSCEVGRAVPTLAYNLDAKYILHAVVPRWIDGGHDEYILLSSAYLSSLRLADHMECESISFPLLSSGNNGFDPRLAFEIAKESIESFIPENLKTVHLVIYGRDVNEFVQKSGFDVYDMPVNLNALAEKAEGIAKAKGVKAAAVAKLKAVEANVAHAFGNMFDNMINKGLAYISEPKTTEKIIEIATDIVKKVMKAAANQIIK